MGKYNHLFPKLTNEQKAKMREDIEKAVKDITDEKIEDSPQFDYIRMCAYMGFDSFDVTMIGPWTLNEYLDMIGLKGRSFRGNDAPKLIKAMEDKGAISLNFKKDLEEMKIYVEHSEKGIDELETCAKEGSEKLSRWDKFCAFFGIKTSHALKVETKAATVRAMNEKKKEVSKKVALIYNKENIKDFKDDYEKATGYLDEIKNATKEKNDDWHKVFFGNATVPSYTLKNGQKISPVSLCLAALQQQTNLDLSSVEPKDVIARMNSKGKEAIGKQIKMIGKDISKIIAKKEAAINIAPRMKYLDDFLFEKPQDVGVIDKELRDYIKPEKNGRKFDIGAAANYNRMIAGKDKENLFANSALLFKTKDDMQKLFGKNDPTYNMKNDDGSRLNEAADKMEQQVRKVYKTIALKDELKIENYEAVLNAAGLGDDFNKLGEAIKSVTNNLNEIKKDLAYGETLKVFEQDDLEKEEEDLSIS